MRPALEHPAQLVASTFLRALAEDDAAAIWERLSRGSRGVLAGLYAARVGLAAHDAAEIGERQEDERLGPAVSPLRDAALRALGGTERVLAIGVSVTRLVDRQTAYVVLLADFGEERVVSAEEWRPGHVLGLTYESREWRIDLAVTARLSADAGLPDPLGEVRR